MQRLLGEALGCVWDVLHAMTGWGVARVRLHVLGRPHSGKTHLLAAAVRDPDLALSARRLPERAPLPRMEPTVGAVERAPLYVLGVRFDPVESSVLDFTGRLARAIRPHVLDEAVLYVVDGAADDAELGLARAELHRLLDHLAQNPIAPIPVLVVATRRDWRDARTDAELRTALGLGITWGKDRAVLREAARKGLPAPTLAPFPLELWRVSSTERLGTTAALQWLADFFM